MDPLEDCCDPGKMHIFQRPGQALEQCNEYSQIVFIDCSCFRFADSLIGPGGLLLLVSHLFAGSICGWSGLWKQGIVVSGSIESQSIIFCRWSEGKKNPLNALCGKWYRFCSLGSFFTMTSSCAWELSRNHLRTHANFVLLGSFPTFLDLGLRWIRDHGILFAGDD